jgi:hypothetical protein
LGRRGTSSFMDILWLIAGVSMTFPRILYQAWLLTYMRHLPVFPRPDPPSTQTIGRLDDLYKVGWIERVSKHYVQQILLINCPGVRIVGPANSTVNGRVVDRDVFETSPNVHYEIELQNWDFWVWMFLWGLSGKTSMRAVVECLSEEGSISFKGQVDDVLTISEPKANVMLVDIARKLLMIFMPVSNKGQCSLDSMYAQSLNAWSFSLYLITLVVSGVIWCGQYAVFDAITPWETSHASSPWARMKRHIHKSC